LELYDDKLFIKNFHFLGSKNIKFPLNAKCKIRYRQADQDCTIYKEDNRYRVDFIERQRAISSGQICAIYLEDELIMS
jgi:tRNA-specific 2-thiouridylase